MEIYKNYHSGNNFRLQEEGDRLKHGDLCVECDEYEQWKAVMIEELHSATSFEIHCWHEESEWIELALQYGSKKEIDWNAGVVITGTISLEFEKMILGLQKPKDTDIYNKMTPFFSTFLNNGFVSEHL